MNILLYIICLCNYFIPARPELELKGLDKVTEGETLHLYCKETGYPLSAISWYKDGIEISKTDARHNFMSYDNVENGHFVLYSVTATDTGNYECKEVSDTVEPTKSSLFVTVKSTYLCYMVVFFLMPTTKVRLCECECRL